MDIHEETQTFIMNIFQQCTTIGFWENQTSLTNVTTANGSVIQEKRLWGIRWPKQASLWWSLIYQVLFLWVSHGATSVDMTKHFYDIRLHDLIYMTSIYMTQLLHDTWLHEKHLHEMHLHDKSNEYMTEQNHDTQRWYSYS